MVVGDRLTASKAGRVFGVVELVIFGISSNNHFSVVAWVVVPNEMFAFDSYAGCNHYELIERVLRPFAAYCKTHFHLLLRAANSPSSPSVSDEEDDVPVSALAGPSLKRKDALNGIERQATEGVGQNVCAFSAAFFAGKIFTAVINSSESGFEVDALALAKSLQQMKICSSYYSQVQQALVPGPNVYAKARKQYIRTIGSLISEYALSKRSRKRKAEETGDKTV